MADQQESLQNFRSFVVKKYPKMTNAQLKQLDDFISQKQAQDLVSSGKIGLSDLPIDQRVGVAAGLPEDYEQKITLKGQPATNVALLKNILNSAQAAQTSWKPEYTGLLNSLLGTGSIAFNRPGAADQQQFRQKIADIRTAVRQAISGAAISPTEGREIEGLLPNITQSDTKALAQLEGLLGMAKYKVGNVLSTAGYDIPVEQYLQQGAANKPNVKNDPLGLF